MKYKYQKLMAENPTIYAVFTNSKGQEIKLAEHPRLGDESFVIVICDELKLAQDSTFFETDDMMREDKAYEPSFVDGKLFLGELEA